MSGYSSSDNAVETTCCHQLYCLPCIEPINTCPTCRKSGLQMVPAYFARRLIGSLNVLCPNEGCGIKVTNSDLAKHLSTYCEYRQLTCPDPQCENVKCTKKPFIEHLVNKHEQLLLENFAELWQKQKTTGRMTVIHTSEKSTDRVEASPAAASDDRLERTRNRFGQYARLGSSGKFYCSGRLDGFRCTCDGRCGPTSGCNCSGCMQLDVQKKQLPRGWLVNRDGASARCSTDEPTKFYCGRRVLTHDRMTDGYCGPNNGNQCEACLKLNEQQFRRYGQVWE